MRHNIPTTALLSALSVLLMCGCSSKGSSSEVIQPTGEPVDIEPESIVFEWQEAFEQKLTEFASSSSCKGGLGGSMFDMRDLDGDSVPELFISPDNDTTTLCEVYTYSDGSLVKLDTGERGGSGEVGFIPSMKVLRFRYSGESFEMGSYCTYGTGGVEERVSFYNNKNSLYSGAELRYEINGSEVTISDYDNALSAYKSRSELTLGRKYTFSDTAIKYAVHCSESWGVVLTDKERRLYKKFLTERLDKADPSAAFELCDLNGDDCPELIYSEGEFDFAACRIYAVEEGRVVEKVSDIGSGGLLRFDVDSGRVVVMDEANELYLDYESGELKSGSSCTNYMELGRKNPLSPEAITSALR